MVRLGDVCTFYSGTGFPNIYQGKADGKYPFYKVGDISRNVLSGNRELKICENYIDDDTVTKIKGTLLPPQTVVFAKIGEALRLNRRAITSRDCLVDNNAMGIKSDDSIIDSLYFYYFMCNCGNRNTSPAVGRTAPYCRCAGQGQRPDRQALGTVGQAGRTGEGPVCGDVWGPSE